MPSLKILGTGLIDKRDAAFPQSVQLPNGEILCSYGVGGGQFVHGGTDWAKSTDGGLTWNVEGTILPPTTNPTTANFLKLSLSADKHTIYAYGTRYVGDWDDRFGERVGETLFCRSTDGGKSWSAPEIVPMPDRPLEVSFAIVPLSSGRLLAPAALLGDKERLGEEMFVAVSDDRGRTWPTRKTVFRDPAGKLGFWEHKFSEYKPGHIIATAWTVTLGDYVDQENSFCFSHDGGESWGPYHSTGIRGQTMSTLPLGDDRLLVLYNRRYGQQGIVMAVVRFTENSWELLEEGLLYDAKASREKPPEGQDGVDELASFQFGFPTAIRLQDGTILATHWCVEQELSSIRWTKLAVEGIS